MNYMQTLQLQLHLAQLQQQQAQLSRQQQLARQQQHLGQQQQQQQQQQQTNFPPANGMGAGLERFFNAGTPLPGMPAQVRAHHAVTDSCA